MASSETPAIDIDDESVLSSIFKEKFSESERRNPEFALYLSNLSSFGINKLNLEPSRLGNEKARILDLTQELAFHNYKTFIRTAECSKDIFQDFSVIEERLQNMLEKLPLLSEHGQSFTKEANDIGAVRRANSLTLTRHTEILEILEIPQLMDTCVRNQYYEDALELMFYVKRLDKKQFIAEIPIMSSVIKDVQQSAQLMLEQLLTQLRSSIQLPACLKIVGFLRRLECFTESELRLRFLQARNSWLESVLGSITSGDNESDAYDKITRTIEVCRVHLFDIVTQYRAIFSDDSNILYNDGINKSIDSKPYDASIFHCWLTYRINSFVKVIKEALEIGVGNRLDSVLGQCMYFGQSFSRVGADFRCLLIPIFQKTAVQSFSKIIEQTTYEFQDDMMSYSLLATSVAYNQMSSIGAVSAGGSGDTLPQPPIGLVDFPPLAVYLNGMLAALNQLRMCCPLSMVVDLAQVVSESVKSAAKVIVAYYFAEEPAFSSSEKNAFLRFCNAFTDDMLPHVQACIQCLLSHQVITDSYGSVNLSAQQMKDNFVNMHEVLSILEPCLPQKVTEEAPADADLVESESVVSKVVQSDDKPLHSGSSDALDDSEVQPSSENTNGEKCTVQNVPIEAKQTDE
ncbi:conserved oligomeric Golgi complex subunit 8-like [Clavelina lepadiformis]|uniref:conserved oligomeric Golgi complex subunit 8-like n=1 Tax=Clavelina lepadiformis TaxID=159417 RepID=UPI0040410411